MSGETMPTLGIGQVTLRAPLPDDQIAYQGLGRHAEIVTAFGGDTPANLDISEAAAAA
jgi:hypothetical protein